MSLARVNLKWMITGYDSETLREQVDRAAVESRLAELGSGRSTAALGEKAELLRLLGRYGEALVAAEHAFRLAHFSGDREQLTAARLRRARVFQYQGELDRALAEMTAVRATATLEEWASLEGSAAYSAGCALRPRPLHGVSGSVRRRSRHPYRLGGPVSRDGSGPFRPRGCHP